MTGNLQQRDKTPKHLKTSLIGHRPLASEAALQNEKSFARSLAVETLNEGQLSGSHLDSDPEEQPETGTETESGAAYHRDAQYTDVGTMP